MARLGPARHGLVGVAVQAGGEREALAQRLHDVLGGMPDGEHLGDEAEDLHGIGPEALLSAGSRAGQVLGRAVLPVVHGGLWHREPAGDLGHGEQAFFRSHVGPPQSGVQGWA